ncbi:M23 family metallopeptidase [Paenibacillus physcomitrellae]|uniref:Metalloendopeptidase n=1 Tax=Paenibacillus physcomitrellae TaxID=1619311 RepID=A0ABQ1GNM2_9BACL|nr:M23 family metallopeptidase [Paenibacillus physcomitrellae]GGA46996.1 metalloendopeptidase [Paenibacillus physcomitrellae]
MNDLNQEQVQKDQAQPGLMKFLKSRKVILSAGTVLLAGGIFLAGHQYVEANKVPYYHVYYNGQEIGGIKNTSQLEQAYKERQAELDKQYPDANIVLRTDSVTTELQKEYKADVDSKATLDKLEELLPYHAEGVEIKIGGETVAVVKDEAAAAEVLNEVSSKYVPGSAPVSTDSIKLTRLSASDSAVPTPLAKTKKTAAKTTSSSSVPQVESVKFVEKIEAEPFAGSADQVLSVEEAAKRLLQDKEESVTYKVKEGDTISEIAKRMGTTQKEIFQLNPGLSELKVQIGQELNIKKASHTLTVQSVERTYESVVTEPPVETRTNSKLAEGKTVIASPGAHGSKIMNYEVVKENGKVVSKQFIGQTVTKATSPKIIVKGTMKIVKASAKKTSASSSSSMFAWPISSPTITSPFGTRWGEMHKGTDMISSNYTIHAAADGKVTFTGVKTGYGNCIVIKHANGYETLYGHLSKISVSTGDNVSQGDKIGIMGSTGHSTGIHLHFEIHKNGELQNPTKYLN